MFHHLYLSPVPLKQTEALVNEHMHKHEKTHMLKYLFPGDALTEGLRWAS